MNDISHNIQRDIVQRLMTAESLRFSELKPSELESNSFMYHLKILIREKYIEKVDEGYQLTPLGLTYVDSLSNLNYKPRKQPKLLTIVAMKNNQGEWLLARRKQQPYIGQWMLPSGKQHFGESTESHVIRELMEQFGIQSTVERRGLCDMRIYKGENLLTHMIAHIYKVVGSNAVLRENEKFEYAWKRPSDVLLLAGTTELIASLESEPSQFFLSLDLLDD